MTQFVWIITGCSSGIGEALTKKILEQGDLVVATARAPVNRLKHLEDAGAKILELDVTADQMRLNAIAEEAIKAYGRIDVVVLNAGYVEAVFLEDTTQQRWDDQLATNFFGEVKVVNAFLPHLRSRRDGIIAFINSLAAYSTSPCQGPYSVAKRAVSAYAETLKQEIESFSISTILFEVGHVRTPIIGNGTLTRTEIDDYKPFWPMMEQIKEGLNLKQPGDPEKLAESIMEVVRRPFRKSMIVPLGEDSIATIRACADYLKASCDEYEETASIALEGPREGFYIGRDHHWTL